ncbi:MAG TPA: MCE family protein [Jatrophihabitantaceae bacterium]|nr:MCE family protein [Jatrophihabitantaceae bacterium]
MALVGTVLVAAVVLASLNLDKLPFVHRTVTYHAQFANADGLRPGDDVRVEGISVGKVNAVKVEGSHVRVDFTVRSGLHLGGASSASIEVATVLGDLFMQVVSGGPGTLPSGGTIPVSRTTVPYTLLDAFDQVGEFGDQTDLPALRTSLRTVAATLQGIAPDDARAALNGLADVSQTLAGKQQQISRILTAAASITDTLNNNSAALVQVLGQSNEFLALLRRRQQVIDSLLRHTVQLGRQLRELIDRNGAQLQPLLSNLDKVGQVLAADKQQLQQAVVNLGSFSVNIANATGSGPWLDLLSPVAVTPDNVIVGCGPQPDSKSGPCQ